MKLPLCWALKVIVNRQISQQARKEGNSNLLDFCKKEGIKALLGAICAIIL